MIRVNTRISKTLNDWLDKRTLETGVPKSTMIYLALEQFRRDTSVVENMGTMQQLVQRLDEIEKKIDS